MSYQVACDTCKRGIIVEEVPAKNVRPVCSEECLAPPVRVLYGSNGKPVPPGAPAPDPIAPLEQPAKIDARKAKKAPDFGG